MYSPPSPDLSEEDQRLFENFSGVVGSLPLVLDNLSPAALAINSCWENRLRLARRDRRLLLRSEAGAMALGLIEALPDASLPRSTIERLLKSAQLSYETIVELVRREVDLTDGEAASILHLVSSVSNGEQSAVPDYNPDSQVEDEEAEDGSEVLEADNGGDDGDKDNDEEDTGDASLREMSSSDLNCRS